MSTSVDDQTTLQVDPNNSSSSSQLFLQKLKSMIGFFHMSKDELVEAGIDKGEYHESQDQENQSDLPITRDGGRIM